MRASTSSSSPPTKRRRISLPVTMQSFIIIRVSVFQSLSVPGYSFTAPVYNDMDKLKNLDIRGITAEAAARIGFNV